MTGFLWVQLNLDFIRANLLALPRVNVNGCVLRSRHLSSNDFHLQEVNVCCDEISTAETSS
jgi:hypothetical protein